jgi:anti-sigma regulatory factor (Ser/Thr protein kinase)
MIRAEYLFPRNLPDVEVDQEAFSHAIRNIVTNSMQAMDKGVVRFSAENIPHSQLSYRPDLPLKAGDYICLHIQDQGHGISEKALPRVFEPYFTTRSGSQGLGLTTALSSVQRMGGTILIDSTPGVGTTISLYLPAATGAAAAVTPSSSGALPTISATSAALGATGALPKPGTGGWFAGHRRFCKSQIPFGTVRYRDDGSGHSQWRGRPRRRPYHQENRSRRKSDRQQRTPRTPGHARSHQIRI